MRATLFAVGLTWAANAACAQAIYDTTDTVALTNGCVYTQNQLAAENEWSLIYTEAGTTVQCPLTIYGLTADATDTAPATPEPIAAFVAETTIFEDATAAVTRRQSVSGYAPQQRIVFNPSYMVGVFR